MGRRSRTRAAATGEPRPARTKSPRSVPGARRTPGRRSKLSPARKALAAYVLGAALLAVLVLLGTIVLVGSLGPFIVLAYTLVGAALLYRWTAQRIAGEPLGDEDRFLQTLAGGLLAITVLLAVVFAVVLTVS